MIWIRLIGLKRIDAGIKELGGVSHRLDRSNLASSLVTNRSPVSGRADPVIARRGPTPGLANARFRQGTSNQIECSNQLIDSDHRPAIRIVEPLCHSRKFVISIQFPSFICTISPIGWHPNFLFSLRSRNEPVEVCAFAFVTAHRIWDHAAKRDLVAAHRDPGLDVVICQHQEDIMRFYFWCVSHPNST